MRENHRTGRSGSESSAAPLFKDVNSEVTYNPDDSEGKVKLSSVTGTSRFYSGLLKRFSSTDTGGSDRCLIV